MEQLKSMKEMLTAQVHSQLANIEKADYHELGAAIDMIKDMAETEYYCSVVKAMEEAEEEKQEQRGTERYYYTERYMPIPYQRVYDRDMDRGYGRMYYNGGGQSGQGGNSGGQGGGSGGNAGGGSSGGSGYSDRGGGRMYYEDPRDMGGNDRTRYYFDSPYMMMPPYERSNILRDPREGRSADRRRMYMESKEMHQGKEKQMQELESYMTELSGDITDMIHGASPEERQMLQKKLSALANKIDQVG